MALQADRPRLDRRRSSTPTVDYLAIVPAFILAGIGMGLFFAPIANVVLSAVRPEEEGKASGANNAIREVGGVFGVAVLASVFSANGGYTSPQAFVDGMVPAMWVGAGVLAVAAVAALFVPAKRRVLPELHVPELGGRLAPVPVADRGLTSPLRPPPPFAPGSPGVPTAAETGGPGTPGVPFEQNSTVGSPRVPSERRRRCVERPAIQGPAIRHPRRLARIDAGARICPPNDGSVLWGCVVSTGPGCLETRAEVPSGLVKPAAKRSNCQQAACSRPRRLGGKVSMEAASPSRAVEVSLSEGATRQRLRTPEPSPI